MSGLNNRGCFKCGALGHMAEQCPAETRLCFNCKESGHESASCPNPRTAEARQCYTCGGVGHLSAECPNLTVNKHRGGNRIASGGGGGGSLGATKCHNCGQFGHISRSCNQSSHGPVRSTHQSRGIHARVGGYNKSRPTPIQPIQCYKCQGMNHYARDCMAIEPSSASQSNQSRTKNCFNCRRPGHIAINCPGPVSS
ncbi:hypothetical protein MJO28_005729 [Puccinia striiformis f. sp. tritici]|uniref:CCHC-type domain-containing protein n=2 Tax=Puccinia striiformis TaxID=27350 RepID=A0A2S4WLP8_9BASI|nr:hypothetical protein Pst134EA_009835 [Puccinia striiformis f. sp. tritici]KAH9469314.1 hypothetical protein Pst134EA_009835 [Puccinia striiformis f. sp. tritici]KAI7955329.1 hypothetical protein MJO28_005729 [Puccinia striiformis f. sp. tritici]POW22705.1 hypothetical protein PSHT_00975 [Puccinia striiformis]